MPAIVIPSISTKGSPSMIMRSAKVPLSPSSALQTIYFWSAAAGDGFPLDPGRKSGAAAAAQARLRDLFGHRRGRHLQRPFQALVAIVSAIVVQRTRIDDAATGEGQPRLSLEERNILGPAEKQRMLIVAGGTASNGPGVGDSDRAWRSACRRHHLDHRLQPIKAARTVPHDFDLRRRCGAGAARNLVAA